MDLRIVRKVWDSFTLATCLDCGKPLHIKLRDVHGWGIHCHQCMVRRLDGEPTPDQKWSRSLNLRMA